MSEDHERSSHCCAAGCDATTDATKFSLVQVCGLVQQVCTPPGERHGTRRKPANVQGRSHQVVGQRLTAP